MDFRIGRYDLYFFTVRPNVIGPIAQLLLYDTINVYRGDLLFQREIKQDNFYDPGSNTFQLRMHESQLESVLATLRNGNSCFIRHYDQVSPILSTTEAARMPLWPGFLDVVGRLRSRFNTRLQATRLKPRAPEPAS